jgi:Tfp pilus assembly protein PilF
LDRTAAAQTHLTAGIRQLDDGAYADARASLLAAVALAPDSANARFHLARAHTRLGAFALAEAAARAALALDPDHAGAAHSLGAVLAERGDVAEALPWLRLAAALAPRGAQVRRDLGAALVFLGQFDEARVELMAALDLDPLAPETIDTAVRLQSMAADQPRAEALFALLNRLAEDLNRFAPSEQAQILFGLAKALEDRGDYDGAFDAMARANALHRAGLTFDIDAAERRMAAIAEMFDADRLASLAGHGADSARPVFIVGMPRSGTTLAEQIVSAHPAVHGAGERPDLPNWIAGSRDQDGAPYPFWARTMNAVDCRDIGETYLRGLPAKAADKARVTDKWLDNFEHLGLIHACLPNATIVHCQRDPRDVGLSAFAIRFSQGQAYSYDLAELGRYWRAYDRLMAHWRQVLPPGRMLEVPYEAVVTDLEGWARRLIAHCGLMWDDACLRFHDSKRPVRSASYAQVRQPIYDSSVGRWRRFERHLGPLLDALGPPWNA